MRIIYLVFFLPFFLNADRIVGTKPTNTGKKTASSGTQKQDRNNSRIVDTRPGVKDDKKSQRPNLKERIEQGLKNGTLTQAEYDKLMQQHAELKSFRQGAKADGEVSAEERQAITAERKKLREELKKEKTNGDFEPEKQLASFTERVVDGVVKKKMTSEEFTIVDNKITDAKARLEAAKADGTVDAEEEAELSVYFQEISKLIYNEKHDKERSKTGYAIDSNDLYQQISDSIKNQQGQ